MLEPVSADYCLTVKSLKTGPKINAKPVTNFIWHTFIKFNLPLLRNRKIF